MKIQIKHRWNLNVLFECDALNLKAALILAVKQKTNLRGADLRGADLRGADLQGADLQGADLRGADLQGAIGLISFTANKHFAFAWQFNKTIQISIGCICMPIKDWLNQYKTIGKKEKYTKQEIDTYGAFIKLSKTALQTKTKNKGKTK